MARRGATWRSKSGTWACNTTSGKNAAHKLLRKLHPDPELIPCSHHFVPVDINLEQFLALELPALLIFETREDAFGARVDHLAVDE